MEKFMKPYDKEFMKMAMLKHEETFKEQVYELHRLYRIQKMLMKNVPQSNGKGQNQEMYLNYQNENSRHQKINTHNNAHLEQLAAKEYVTEVDGDGGLETEEEDEIELTLAPSSFQRRRSRSDNSDSAFSISSSSSGSSQIKRGERKQDNMMTHKWGLVAGSNPSFLSGRKNNSDIIEEQITRQDRVNQQPPWLYQVLSLNMT